MLIVTKDDVRGANEYYGWFYFRGCVMYREYILLPRERNRRVLFYDFESGTWDSISSGSFNLLVEQEKNNEHFTQMDEQAALWYLEQHHAFNGEGDDKKVAAFLAEWTEKKEQYRAAWENGGNWPAKYVNTTFYLKGKQYSITPDSIGLENGECWDEGFLEFLQGDIGEDLKKLGATEIRHMGFLD